MCAVSVKYFCTSFIRMPTMFCSGFSWPSMSPPTYQFKRLCRSAKMLDRWFHGQSNCAKNTELFRLHRHVRSRLPGTSLCLLAKHISPGRIDSRRIHEKDRSWIFAPQHGVTFAFRCRPMWKTI